MRNREEKSNHLDMKFREMEKTHRRITRLTAKSSRFAGYSADIRGRFSLYIQESYHTITKNLKEENF